MAEPNKDTIYIDIDDEITAIIEKVRNSSGKVVALVLPKRASTLQSIVNMKLLKRTADDTKKNIVLITTETGLLPLAGAVGLHVAKTPSSRPEIPAGPLAITNAEEQVDETDDLFAEDENDAIPLAGGAAVGDLAASTMPVPASRPAPESGIETVELDNDDEDVAAASTATAAATKKPKVKKDKKLAVPDFDRFRVLLIAGGVLLLVLIVGGYLALVVLPKATISIKTDASNVNTNVDFNLSTAATTFNAASKTIPAKQVQSQKTYTGSAPASGQQNNGDKAHGQIIVTTQECAPNLGPIPNSLPAGTGVSSGGQTYITQEAAVFGFAGSSKSCNNYKTNSVDITAQKGGQNGNTSSGNATFTVSGHSEDAASGSANGGTDNITQVVTQADIDSAKGKISTTDPSIQSDLTSQLKGQELYALSSTYNVGTPSVTTSSNVGDAASSVTVTETITYTMLGANEANIKTLVDNDIKSQINTAQQGILSEGITQAAFKLSSATSSGAAMNVQTAAEVGPTITTAAIASQAAGKKSGEIQSSIKSNPDVTDVTVKLSPFWVTKAPKNTSKITVTVAKPTKTAKANAQ